MSTTEAACYSTPEAASLRVEPLAFARTPNQSRLFLEYLRAPQTLRRFYPNAVEKSLDVINCAPEVLAAQGADRRELCDALEAMNRRWDASVETLENIARLRNAETVVVVSGQQVGLFTGPLYTIYKALSAVKLARCLTQRGVSTVPVFWLATEDHDWAEVASAEAVACDGHLRRTQIVQPNDERRTSAHTVGAITLGAEIEETIKQFLDALPSTEFTPELETLLRESYASGVNFGDAFARMMTRLVGSYGLILLDPLDARLKKLAAPIYAKAAQRAPEIARALEARSRELAAESFHAQVLVSEDSFPLFLHINGERRALTRTGDGKYKAKGERGEEYTIEELAALAADEPERFSPNVTLRAVVQDYLLPTVAYFGGAAEIAYFAQTSEVYRLLERPATTILPRASLTFIERRAARTLERYNLRFEDLFAGEAEIERRVVEERLSKETARLFDRTQREVNDAIDALRERLADFDRTLANATETRARKINYQIESLRAKFRRAALERDRTARRQLARLFAALYPEGGLQERRINIASFYARHGHYFVDWIYDAISLSSNEHLLVYL